MGLFLMSYSYWFHFSMHGCLRALFELVHSLSGKKQLTTTIMCMHAWMHARGVVYSPKKLDCHPCPQQTPPQTTPLQQPVAAAAKLPPVGEWLLGPQQTSHTLTPPFCCQSACVHSYLDIQMHITCAYMYNICQIMLNADYKINRQRERQMDRQTD